MKKSLILTLGLFITLIGMMSCGSGADDEARQQAIRDSLFNDSVMQAKIEAALLDSMFQDSLMQAMAYQDSIDALSANAGNGGTKSTPVKPKTDPVVVTPKQDPKPVETGKGAIKNRTEENTTSGKGAIKNRNDETGTGKTTTSGKGAIKNRNK